MELYFPTELGEQLAFGAAAFTALFGLFALFAPGLAFRLLGLQPRIDRTEALGEGRSTIGGFYLGFGLAAILVAQPMVYLAFGASFAMAVFGRVLSILSDQGNTLANYILLVVQVALAALPLVYVFGLI